MTVGAPLRWAALAILAASVASAVATAAAASRELRLKYPAARLQQEARDVRVHLPASYHSDAAKGRRYPVVFLLHGFPGGSGDWLGRGDAGQIADSLAASGAIPEVILVCPDGNRGFFGRSLWADQWDGGFPLAESFVRDLVPWVDSTFRTIPDADHRAIVGLSDGATGGLNLLMLHPESFSAWGGHSGEYHLERNFGMGGIVGPQPGAEAVLRALSPLETLTHSRQLAHARALYLDCGREDESITDNRELHARLEALRIPHEWREFQGSHTWDYWRQHLHESLVAVCRDMGVTGSTGK